MRPAAQIKTTIEILALINAEQSPADKLISNYFRSNRYIGSKDKRAIAELVYAVLRQKGKLQWAVQQLHFKCETELCMARSMVLLHLAWEQPDKLELFNGERYGPKPLFPEEESALKTLDSFSFDYAPEAVKFNIPEWLIADMKHSLEERFEEEMQAMQLRAPFAIRVNTLKSNRIAVQGDLAHAGYVSELCQYSPWGLVFAPEQRVSVNQLETFQQGFFEVQDQGSQLIALAAQVKPGYKVVDFCAGAGGKTLAMGAQMQNKGVIHACDVHSKRLKNLANRQKRAGLHNIQTRLLNSEHDKWVKRNQGKMDVVLIDAPCSGTGTWRRNPDARWNLSLESRENLVELQESILNSASRLVKPGGVLVYATCSLLKAENEDQISLFLEQHNQFQAGSFPMPEFNNMKHLFVSEHELRTYPARDDMDGFYVSVLQRTV